MAEAEATDLEERWRSRGVLAWVLRAAIFLVPILAAVLATELLTRRLFDPDDLTATILWWLAVIVVTTAVLIAIELVARRYLPLVWLLRLSLLFPGKAPSRLQLARRSTKRELRRLLQQIDEQGLEADPARAAETVIVLASALTTHDRFTRGHSERVRAVSELIAEELDLAEVDVDRLRWAALLHDVGKLIVPSHVLNKRSPLTEAEWDLVRRHPEEGARLVAPLRGWLREWGDVVLEHHERVDGTGYPRGCRGDEISLGARIVAVADAYEVMTSARSYSPPRTPPGAQAELARYAGTQFDPGVVRAFVGSSLRRLWLLLAPLALVAQIPLVGQASLFALRSEVAVEATSVAVKTLGSVGTSREAFHGQIGPVATTTTTTVAPPPPTTAPPPTGRPPGPFAAGDDQAVVAPGGQVRIPVAANDGPDEALVGASITVTAAPRFGTAEAQDDGGVVYARTAPGSEPDRFTYEICRGDGSGCDQAEVTVTVAP